MSAFVEVGNALLEIRDACLYREKYDTFEAYCRDRWQISKRRANRLIGSAEVVRNLGPMGPIIISERLVRPLTNLPLDTAQRIFRMKL